jgi:simple sugar transport system ATP-binding protein
VGEGACLLEAVAVSKRFGAVEALRGVSLQVRAGEVTCLLGDNGAGKSTLIQILSGVFLPDSGGLRLEGEPVKFRTPADAINRGICTVYQDLAIVPLMSVSRNFWLGREPTRGRGVLKRIDSAYASKVARDELAHIGIDLKDVKRPLGTLSGGQRQCVAIARAAYFGATVLILDEPTAALGVREATIVLGFIGHARERGLGIVLITHNPQHALPVGDSFVVLSHGEVLAGFRKGEMKADELELLMAGGAEAIKLEKTILDF